MCADVFLEERVTTALREAEERQARAWELEQIRDADESGRPLRRRLAEALFSLGRKIDPDVLDLEASDQAA